LFAIALAFGTALFESFKDLFSKISLRVVDVYAVAVATHFVQTLVLVPVVFYTGFFIPTENFLWALLAAVIIQFAVVLLYLKALQISDISTSIPFITLTPLFMLISSPIMIGEFPNTAGLFGIVLIVAGTWLINYSKSNKSIFAPFKSLIVNKGSRYMLIVAFLWSITANIDKIGVQESSPVFWAFSKDALLMLLFILLMLWKSEKPFHQIKKEYKALSLIGFLRAGSAVTQMVAIQFILVSYVIAIKRSSALFVILWGYLFLNEKENMKTKLSGIMVILAGLALIVLTQA
jgi:drug/metabolite transporter (DMT)-like permease